MKYKNVAIIPARGNSKGVPGKNLKSLGGMPLIDWTLHAAFNAGKSLSRDALVDDSELKFKPLFDLILITSEDEKILEEATKIALLYPDVEFFPYKRLPELSQDHVQTDEVCLDVLRFIELNEGEDSVGNICLLQPTSPFRESFHLNESFKLWDQSYDNHGCLVSGTKVFDTGEDHSYMWAGSNDEYSTVEPIGHNPQYRLGRQWEKQLPTQFFLENGAIYWFDAEEFSLKRSYRQPPFVMYEMDAQVDINTKEDWEEAERVIREDGWHIAKLPRH